MRRSWASIILYLRKKERQKLIKDKGPCLPEVQDIGPVLPLVDPEEMKKALGAEDDD